MSSGARALAAALLVAATGTLLTACSGAPPQIVSLDPVNGTSGVPVDQPVRVTFDHGVDRGTVGSRLHVDPAIKGCDMAVAFAPGPAPSCHAEWSADSAGFVLLHPGALFAPGTRYRFTLDPGVADPAGVQNGLDHHWEMTTGAGPGVTGISPSDGAGNVGIDTEAAITFDAPMDAARTVSAIVLSPPVSGTRVVRNTADPSRFLVLPGALLQPQTTYTITVAVTAADTHGAPLRSRAAVRFTTGSSVTPGDHAVILAGPTGHAASAVLLASTIPLGAGDPPAAVTVLSAPRCALGVGCGGVAVGEPTQSFLDGTLSPDGTHLAVVVRDETATPVEDRLIVLRLGAAGSPVSLLDGAGSVAWAPDGSRLAVATATAALLVGADGGAPDILPVGGRPTGAPVWSSDGSSLAIPVVDPAGQRTVALADPGLRISYQVPGLRRAAVDPVLSPDGSVLAVRVDAPATDEGLWVVHLRTADASPGRLGADLAPVAFSGSGTLVATQGPRAGSPATIVRLALAGGDADRIGGPLTPAAVPTVVAAASGRTLAYLQADVRGVVQAWVENDDGSRLAAVTTFLSSSLQALSVRLG